jgi:hypothetical protein
MTYSNGDIYEGDWKTRKHHDKGKQTYNGHIYKGIWKNGKSDEVKEENTRKRKTSSPFL